MSAIEYFEHSLTLSSFEIGMKIDLFWSLATTAFSRFAGILSAALLQHHLLEYEIAQLEFHQLHSLCSQGSFLRPIWLHIPGCLALGENQFSSVAQSCTTLFEPMNCSTPGFSVHHQLPELAQFSFQFQRKAMPKNVQTHTIALISHASKVMFKILQVRLQQYVNWELSDGQAEFRWE